MEIIDNYLGTLRDITWLNLERRDTKTPRMVAYDTH